MKRIKTGDTVLVNTGKSKHHVGKVLRVVGEKVVVEGANLIKKHVKPNPQLDQRGGIVSKEAPIHVSNVSLYNPVTKKADRVGFKFIEKDGNKHKVRYFKSNDELVDLA
ncbi:50S ribosomal protein L24 [Legionella yabuuchiae]|uniref:50S ribosomal protein L24 n=1 Tax=Legionella yabuuchiae TaxID=376727 RepID=UPI0010545D66|nr:50S ribosomal protein L24 [Legionella yabuuchiae]